jgi:hypothetical protein
MAYRRLWRVVAGTCLAIGLLTALLVLPFGVWLVVSALAVVLGLTLAVCCEAGTPDGQGPVRAVRVTAALYLIAMAVAGVAQFLGVGVLAVVGLLLITSPQAVQWCRRWLTSSRSPVPSPLATISTNQLCRDWLDSYDQLARASSSDARLRVVMTRQRYLDELERRDPDGLRAWLASSASAGGDPRRFLTDSGS